MRSICVACLLFCLLLVHQNGQASHIIGGEVTYECLGYSASDNSNLYEFTMIIYRNCNRFAMDILDDRAPIGIFKSRGNDFEVVSYQYARLRKPTDFIPLDNSNPCLILPDDICVEEGIYKWRSRLPVIDETYHITYQRCCRNASINNIVEPDQTGASYTVQISPESQQICNSSPVFSNFPPIVICANEPLNFDHSAVDKEGDQVTYEFCDALVGGGILGAFLLGDEYSCEGFRPDPACPPPYDPVSYTFPTYTASRPMGGNPLVQINPTTGRITGTPRLKGQYVVAVCVKEYRNGVLLSQIQRDFQFNVTDCEPLVDAIIDGAIIVDDQSYIINSCGDSTVELGNSSIQEEFINQFRWNFEIQGDTVGYTVWEPTITFPDTGRYNGALFLNEGSECGDTAYVTINIQPNLEADFEFNYDTCRSGPVGFVDLSVSEGKGVTKWFWDFGGQGSSDEVNPDFLFADPGIYPIQLRVEDGEGCNSIVEKSISWFPAPSLVVVEPNRFENCLPANVAFNNLSQPIDESYNILWDFGDGGSSSQISPTHLYDEVGRFNVSVRIVSPIGCEVVQSWPDWIDVFPSPFADFSFTPDQPSNFQPFVQFRDESEGATNWEWSVDKLAFARDQDPSYNFPDTGIYEIQLIVQNEFECPDTAVQILDVEPQIRYFIPNAFTPNGDAVNDIFKGKGVFEGLENFNFQIFNRWGEMVYETTSPDDSWNGRKFNTGQKSPEGVYVYVISFDGPRGKSHQFEGFATLLR